MSKSNDIREIVVSLLENLKTKDGVKEISFANALNTEMFPHIVFSFDGIRTLQDDLHRRDVKLLVDCYDKSNSAVLINNIADDVESILGYVNNPTSSILPTFIFEERRDNLPDEDKNVRHSQLKFTIQIMKGIKKMANKKIGGTGLIASTDYHKVTWTGKTKNGDSVIITLPKALNMGNLEWTFAEKDDVVGTVTFTSVYSNTDEASTSTVEPFTIEYIDSLGSGAAEIILGAGIFAIDDVDVALTRGGGSFKVEREFRNINADGDRGSVEGRVVIDASNCTLELNALTMLTKVDKLYPAMADVTSLTSAQ